jgi:hypothetical protein
VKPSFGLLAFALAAALLLLLAGPSVGVRDAGELSAAAFAVDVPHPTGFAADMVLLRLAMLLPVGDIAFRANVATALWMALAAALTARLAYALASSVPPRPRAALALLAPTILLASRTVLRAGTAVEVYALSLSVSLGALALVFAPPQSLSPAARTRCAALLLGTTLLVHTGARPAVLVALGLLVAQVARSGGVAWILRPTPGAASARRANRLSPPRSSRAQTSVTQTSPPAFLATTARPSPFMERGTSGTRSTSEGVRSEPASTPGPRFPMRRLAAWALCGLTGALAVLYLPLAARRQGPIDWGDPRDLPALLAHLSAARIRSAYADRILVPWRAPEDFARVAGVLYEDVGPVVLLLGLLGAAMALRERRVRWLALVALGDVLYATLINPMGVGDRQTLFVAEAGLAVLAAYALATALSWARTRRPARSGALEALATALAVGAMALTVVRSDGAYAARADGWASTEILGGAGALGALPARSLVLCESDDLCGGALYAQIVEGERPDVTVLPRQHLADPSTWRRVRASVLGAPVPAPVDGGDLRVARLRALLASFGPRVRWEPGETLDERLARITPGTAESPVLAALGTPVLEVEQHTADWLAPRLSDGVGARMLAASVLSGAGRRVAGTDMARAVTLWEQALAFDPERSSLYTNLAVARARAGDLSAAVALTEHAVTLDPDRLVAWRNLAEFRTARGDHDGAAEARREYQRRGGR